jgi:hypothetical protein
MNILTPIILLIAGAFGVWFVRYLNAPRPFEFAIIGVVVILLLIWLLGLGGIWIDPVADID